LRALRHLLRPDGRIAYTTIFVTPGLSPTSRRRAQRSGPRAVGSRSDQRQLLVSAGFRDIAILDVTAAFARTASAWIDGWSVNEAALTLTESPEVFAERQRDRSVQLRAVHDGLLRRALFSATRA
jgi:hypothetical protein